MNANVVGTKYSTMPQFETIQFRLILTAEYWNLPPYAAISINDVELKYIYLSFDPIYNGIVREK